MYPSPENPYPPSENPYPSSENPYPSPEHPDELDPRYGGPRPPLGGPAPMSTPLSAPLAADVLPTGPSHWTALPAESPPSMVPPSTPPPTPPPPTPPPPTPPPPASVSADASPADEQRARIRDDVEGLRLRASVAASWLETSSHYAQLVNHAGVVPVTARFSREDLMFLGEARGQMLRFADLALRLIELHQPGDAGGLSTHPSSPILRCRSCMWRWPCPTFSIVTEVLDRPAPT
jgi:hypothetical protein